MKLKNHNRVKLLFFAILLFFNVDFSLAQPGNPGDDPDNPVPIDGVSILMALGGALGAKKAYDLKKKKSKGM